MLCLALSRDCKQQQQHLHSAMGTFLNNLPCQSPISFLQLQNPTPAPPAPGKGQGWSGCLIQISSPSRQTWLHTSGGHVLLEALPGIFYFCFSICFFCRPSSKLSSRSSQGVESPIQKHSLVLDVICVLSLKVLVRHHTLGNRHLIACSSVLKPHCIEQTLPSPFPNSQGNPAHHWWKQ